jgi:hypothetical protein
MAITTQSGLVAARATRQSVNIRRASAVTVAGIRYSSWNFPNLGSQQPAASIPTVAALCGRSLSVNYTLPGANTLYMDQQNGGCTIAGNWTVFDRLFHIGGLNGTLTTAQTVNSQTLLTLPIARAAATEVEWFLEIYTALGATTTTANVAVTYTDATTATIGVAIPANVPAGRLLQIVSPTVGKIIASVQSVTLLASTGTVGNFGVTAGKQIIGADVAVAIGNLPIPQKNALLIPIPDDTCFWFVDTSTTTISGEFYTSFTLIAG